MVLKKQEKLHNSPSVKGILIMPKSETHPKWHPDAKVICNGEVVMTTGSTQPELHVDVWSGCLLYTSPSPRDLSTSRMPSSA